MDIYRLDHGNIRTNNLDKMIDWYTEILGFGKGWRPNFPFGGAWMYSGKNPLIHLVHETEQLGERGDLRLEHVAFSARGRKEFCDRLDEKGVAYKETILADAGLIQINIWDPDGNHIHVDFSLDEEK